MRFVAIGCFCAVALAVVGCGDGSGVPTRPSAAAPVSSLSAVGPSLPAAPRSGDLHVTKECSAYTGLADSFCTITSSNVKAIEVGSRVIYLQAKGETSLDSDVILDTPGPGNNKARGHCTLDFVTGVGWLCTFSGGTGKFTGFSATAHVSAPTAADPDWHWEGTYSFTPHD